MRVPIGQEMPFQPGVESQHLPVLVQTSAQLHRHQEVEFKYMQMRVPSREAMPSSPGLELQYLSMLVPPEATTLHGSQVLEQCNLPVRVPS